MAGLDALLQILAAIQAARAKINQGINSLDPKPRNEDESKAFEAGDYFREHGGPGAGIALGSTPIGRAGFDLPLHASKEIAPAARSMGREVMQLVRFLRSKLGATQKPLPVRFEKDVPFIGGYSGMRDFTDPHHIILGEYVNQHLGSAAPTLKHEFRHFGHSYLPNEARQYIDKKLLELAEKFNLQNALPTYSFDDLHKELNALSSEATSAYIPKGVSEEALKEASKRWRETRGLIKSWMRKE